MLGNLKAGMSKYPNALHQGSLECDSAITKNTNEQMWTIEVFYFVCFFYTTRDLSVHYFLQNSN